LKYGTVQDFANSILCSNGGTSGDYSPGCRS